MTSPLLRARQTVEALLEHWPTPHPEQLTCNALAPGGRAKKITRFLLGLNGENVGLVGHMPDLAEYAGWLIGAKKTRLEMAKAGAAFIRFDGSPDKGEGSLVWLATPEWFEGGSSARRVRGDPLLLPPRPSRFGGAVGRQPLQVLPDLLRGQAHKAFLRPQRLQDFPRSSGDGACRTYRCSSAGSDITTSRRNSGGSGWREAPNVVRAIGAPAPPAAPPGSAAGNDP